MYPGWPRKMVQKRYGKYLCTYFAGGLASRKPVDVWKYEGRVRELLA